MLSLIQQVTHFYITYKKKKKSPTQTMLWYVVQYIRKAICLRGWQVNVLTRLDEFQD